ncbi:MAG: divalent metal cation transporter [Acidobacteria bacterium]|nr:MAG: divalent metal cation transporter [Acidobacteriota bacterium]REK01629.1 MAG: divalent metal cation transporter [Acidobacteriota bacterium]REK14585.1 MAG: divalent metal cation transporter [Acidobacteriota bacterium]REK45300.1 MAG: divalent metal cation transporter [Acidobacteriota bacterium]
MADTGTSLRRYFSAVSRFRARLRRSLSGYTFFTYLAVLGPGIIAANAGNDAGGIATYSSVGAAYGYSLLWVFLPMVVSLIIVQEMCVRMGVVTGQGLADLIRERFGVRLTTLVMSALLIANSGVIISQFVGVAQASELLGIPRYLTIPITSVVMWWLVVKGTQERVEQIFLIISLVFLCYIVSAFAAGPDWGEIASEVASPGVSTDPAYLFMVIALIGTTITPFMQFFVQSSTVERGMDEDELSIARADVIVGTCFALMIAAFIVISTAATLHVNGITTVDSAATAAEALAPVVGEYAKYLFAIGLFGASLLAMGVLPLATAYSVSEALGFEKGLSRSFREAPIFLGMFTGLILVGAFVSMIPSIPQIQLLLVTQAVNGLLLPIILVTIVKLSSSREIMGEYRNGTVFKTFAWLITIVVSTLSLLLIAQTFADIF